MTSDPVAEADSGDPRIEILALEFYRATGHAATDADEWATCQRDAVTLLERLDRARPVLSSPVESGVVTGPVDGAECRCSMIEAYLAAPGAAVAVGASFVCPVHGDRSDEIAAVRAQRAASGPGPLDRLQAEHWLVFGLAADGERTVTGCHCGYEASTEDDCGYGDSVVRHLFEVAFAARAVDPLRAGPGEAGSKSAAELLREIAERDPEAHRAALARGYGAGPGEGLAAPTVADVRSAAEAMLRWCDDDRAERQVLGSILIPLLPEVAARVRAEAQPPANLQPGGREVEDFDGRLVETRFTPAELAAHDAAIRARAAGDAQLRIERLHAIMEAAIVRGGYRGDEEQQVAALLAERDQRVRAEARQPKASPPTEAMRTDIVSCLQDDTYFGDEGGADLLSDFEQAVRAEALCEFAAGVVPNHARPADVLVLGARMTEDTLWLVRMATDQLIAAVRAEAVADVRQRIRTAILAACPRSAQYMPRDTYNGMRDAYRHAADIAVEDPPVAAGSVPAATPISAHFLDSEAHERDCAPAANPPAERQKWLQDLAALALSGRWPGMAEREAERPTPHCALHPPGTEHRMCAACGAALAAARDWDREVAGL